MRLGQNAEVLVVGGGPAGLAAAIATSQRGFDVTVADGCAPPIEKPCGEGLLPAALAALERLGVELNRNDGRTFRGICFLQDDAKVSADFPYRAGLGLRRSLLHERLIQRAQACSIRLLWNSPVSAIDNDGACVRGEWIRARWIIGADGHGSRARRAGGLGRLRMRQIRFARRRHYSIEPWSEYTEVHWCENAQAYVTPLGRAEVCVVLLTDRAEPGSFEAGLAEFPALQERLVARPLLSRERGSITATCSLDRVQRNNIALVGDASGGIDAISGEGLRLAFEQALAVADSMREGDLGAYESFHRRLLRRPKRMASLLLWLGRHARIRARAFRALSDRPEFFERMLEMHVGHGKTKDLIADGALLGWQLLGYSGG